MSVHGNLCKYILTEVFLELRRLSATVIVRGNIEITALLEIAFLKRFFLI